MAAIIMLFILISMSSTISQRCWEWSGESHNPYERFTWQKTVVWQEGYMWPFHQCCLTSVASFQQTYIPVALHFIWRFISRVKQDLCQRQKTVDIRHPPQWLRPTTVDSFIIHFSFDPTNCTLIHFNHVRDGPGTWPSLMILPEVVWLCKPKIIKRQNTEPCGVP